MEYIVLGCHAEINHIDHKSKRIAVRKGALISEVENARTDATSVVLDFSLTRLACLPQHMSELDTFTAQTQGLSGSPVLSLRINHSNETQADFDLHIIGVATHVAEKERRLFATPYQGLMACLHHGFNLFPELVEGH